MKNNFQSEIQQMFERYKRLPKHGAEAYNLLVDIVELIDEELRKTGEPEPEQHDQAGFSREDLLRGNFKHK